MPTYRRPILARPGESRNLFLYKNTHLQLKTRTICFAYRSVSQIALLFTDCPILRSGRVFGDKEGFACTTRINDICALRAFSRR